jgi:Ca2+-binding EF-hand superfamily protein
LFRQLDDNNNDSLEFSDFSSHAYFIKKQKGWADDHPGFTNLLAAKRRFWQEIQTRVDTNHDNSISLEEWLTFWEKIVTEAAATGKTADWISQIHLTLFQALDLDEDGTIGLDEYTLYLQSIGVNQDPQTIFEKVDADGNGKLDLDEFADVLSKWVLSNDPNASVNYFVMGSFS